ncbi:MAG: hypothetical protein ABIH46_13150 [Chloroflexota bacterium]
MPAVAICTRGFDVLGRAEARGLGVPELPIVSIPLLFEYSTDQVEELGRKIASDIVAAVTLGNEKYTKAGGETAGLVDRPVFVSSQDSVWTEPTVEAATACFYEKGWGDGLPIVPPTRRAVETMLNYSDRDPQTVVGTIAPLWGKATIEKIAVNAVMAGCRPEYLPVVLAGVEAIAEPAFNLFAIQATTNPVAPLLVVNGPIARELKINARFNAFGPGWPANATVGRAIRLAMMNIGEGLPGITDKAQQGQPGKYTFCIAENEQESPWEPLHVERGFAAETSTVTAIGVQGTHNIHCIGVTSAAHLSFLAAGMSAFGTNNMKYGGTAALALSPLVAQIVAKDGYSKEHMKKYLHEHAFVRADSIHPDVLYDYRAKRPHLPWDVPDGRIPMTNTWEEVMIVVVGFPQRHATFLPTFGDMTIPVTKAIQLCDGKPARSVEDFLHDRPR